MACFIWAFEWMCNQSKPTVLAWHAQAFHFLCIISPLIITLSVFEGHVACERICKWYVCWCDFSCVKSILLSMKLCISATAWVMAGLNALLSACVIFMFMLVGKTKLVNGDSRQECWGSICETREYLRAYQVNIGSPCWVLRCYILAIVEVALWCFFHLWNVWTCK